MKRAIKVFKNGQWVGIPEKIRRGGKWLYKVYTAPISIGLTIPYVFKIASTEYFKMEDASIIQAVIETTVPITSKVFNNILEELDITGKSTIKVDSIDSMVAVKPPDKMDDYGVYYRALSKCGGVIGYWYINNKTGPLPGVNAYHNAILAVKADHNKLLLQYSGDKERMMRDIETVREFDSNYRKMIVTT